MPTIRPLVIRTEKDARSLEGKMAQIQIQYLPFVIATLTTLINEFIIDVIQEKMRAARVSEKVIYTTYLDTHAEQHGETIIFQIKSDYLSDTGFLVIKIIEFGRKAFFVKPTVKRVLSWLKSGLRYFSKGHMIPEKQALHVIADSIKEGQPKVQRELNKRTRLWISDIVKT